MKRFLCAVLTAIGLGAGCGGGSMSMAAPSELSGMPMDDGFHLTWKDNSPDEDEFVVEQKIGSGEFSELARVPFDTNQYIVDQGSAGQEHLFRVMARMGSMMTAPSNEVTWTP